MIDVETEVLNIVKSAATSAIQGTFVTTNVGSWPDKFPCVTVQLVNEAEAEWGGAFGMEVLLFDINIYSNSATKKHSQINSIFRSLHNTLHDKNFRLVAKTTMPVIALTGNSGSAKSAGINKNIYRLVTRYEVAYDGTYFYRRS